MQGFGSFLASLPIPGSVSAWHVDSEPLGPSRSAEMERNGFMPAAQTKSCCCPCEAMGKDSVGAFAAFLSMPASLCWFSGNPASFDGACAVVFGHGAGLLFGPLGSGAVRKPCRVSFDLMYVGVSQMSCGAFILQNNAFQHQAEPTLDLIDVAHDTGQYLAENVGSKSGVQDSQSDFRPGPPIRLA